MDQVISECIDIITKVHDYLIIVVYLVIITKVHNYLIIIVYLVITVVY